MKNRIFVFIFILLFALTTLSACGAAAGPREATQSPAGDPIVIPTETKIEDPAATAETSFENTLPAAEAAVLPAKTDAQGAVEVTVTPLELSAAADQLNFNVVMNTHSVELAFDLATLATLSTGTGLTVTPLKWDAPSGGHHVEGTLSFPAQVDGRPVLNGASQITLTIKGVDASERTYTWELQ